MPTYEYNCQMCGHGFEKEMPVEEKKSAKVVCPMCGSDDVQQIFFGVNTTGKQNTKTSGGCCGGGSKCCG